MVGRKSLDRITVKGVDAYSQYVAQKLEPVARGIREVGQGGPAVPLDDAQLQSATLGVAIDIIRSLKDVISKKVTLENVVDRVLSSLEVPNTFEDQKLRLSVRQAVFHVIARTTLFYSPTYVDGLPSLSFKGSDGSLQHVEMADSHRPILALIRHLGSFQAKICRFTDLSTHAHDVSSPTFDAANVAFAFMHTIGHLTIELSDSLSQHLVMNVDLHRLTIFRFPSVLLAMHASSEKTMLNWLLEHIAVDENRRTPPDTNHSSRVRDLLKEVLVTYFLLFGQNNASRRRYRQMRRHIVLDDFNDPLLDDFCGTVRTPSYKKRDDLAQLMQVHHRLLSTADFPHYGDRLVQLSEYVQSHRPNRLLDLYRDRRDREKFWTFWAVIIFGSVAVVIGLLQTGLSAIQVAFAYKQLREDPD